MLYSSPGGTTGVSSIVKFLLSLLVQDELDDDLVTGGHRPRLRSQS
jgi:hypothetical protein